jgi:cephalosporin hydroxylase
MDKKLRTDFILSALDRWVEKNGNGRYMDRDFKLMEDYSIPENFAIQQIKEEIREFAKLLINKDLDKSILEIGLGYYGSTHFLWRQIFEKVCSIEKSHSRVREFGINLSKFFNDDWVLNDKRSSFMIGMSNDPNIVKNVYNHIKSVDVLFIDGDHSYAGVLTDWLLYSPLVKSGGIVAFHDINLHGDEVGDFIDNLAVGEIDGTPYEIERIVFSRNVGIGFYVK